MSHPTSISTDFLSQASFDAHAVRLPDDALGHGTLASSIIRWTRQLPAGSVIALQGAWGMGKTDVLARVAIATRRGDEEDLPEGLHHAAFWLNPWQYGSPDLLTPMVLAFQEAIEAREGGLSKEQREQLTVAVSGLVRAGLAFGLKGAVAAYTGPAAGLLGALAPAAGGILERLGASKPDERKLDDPVADMATHFKTLTDLLVAEDERELGGRLLVCIDDLDRCLPDRQVALLQALRFLVSAGAPVTFLIALDPALAQEGVRAHYRAEHFDTQRYLDKMFHLRLNLPGVTDEALRELVLGQLESEVATATGDRPLQDLLDDLAGQISSSAEAALPVPGLRNPRVVGRVFRKLQLLALNDSVPEVGGLSEAQWLLTWMALGERWPQVRTAIQDGGDFRARVQEVHMRYAGDRAGGSAAVQALPARQKAPELQQLFSALPRIGEVAGAWERFDKQLVQQGL